MPGVLELPHLPLLWNRFRNRLEESFQLMINKDVLSLSASIAYWTVLSLTPFLLLFFGFLGFLGWRDLPQVREEIAHLLGPSTAIVLDALQSRLENDQGRMAFSAFGLLTLLISASSVITQLQTALNTILAPTQPVRASLLPPSSQRSAVTVWMRTRLYAVMALLFCVFVSTVSLLLSVAIRVFFPIQDQLFWYGLNLLGSFFLFSIVFLSMFRYLPSTNRQPWLVCLKAGLLCSVFFHIGKLALETYFANAGIETSYGALSSFVIFLIWAYYNGLIILMSAAFARTFFYEQA